MTAASSWPRPRRGTQRRQARIPKRLSRCSCTKVQYRSSDACWYTGNAGSGHVLAEPFYIPPRAPRPIAVSLYRTRAVYAKDGSGEVHGCGQGGHHVGTPHVPWTAKREPGFDRRDLSLSWYLGRDFRRGRLVL